MSFPRTKLARIIRLAFANSPYPIGDIVVEDNIDDPEFKEMREVFNNRFWYEITFHEAIFWCSNLPRFTNRAFRYFLPAFLLHSLNIRAGDMNSYVYFYLTPPLSTSDRWEYFQSRISLLNRQQKQAVFQYVKNQFERNSKDNLEYDVTVLYWKSLIG